MCTHVYLCICVPRIWLSKLPVSTQHEFTYNPLRVVGCWLVESFQDLSAHTSRSVLLGNKASIFEHFLNYYKISYSETFSEDQIARTLGLREL